MWDNPVVDVTYLVLLVIAVHMHVSSRNNKELTRGDTISLFIMPLFVPAIFMIILARIFILFIKG